MCPREDKPQSILRVAAIVTLLGWHFDHVPDPSRPRRGPPHLHSWEKPFLSGRQYGLGLEQGLPRGVRGAWLFLWEEKGSGHRALNTAPGLCPALCHHVRGIISCHPQNSPVGSSYYDSIILRMRTEKRTTFKHCAQSYKTTRSRVKIQV